MSTFLKHDEPVLIWTGKAMLDGVLTVPRSAEGLVIIVGLGGTFHHDAIRLVAGEFQFERFATLIADVLTADEQQFDARTGHFRVDTEFLVSRVRDIVDWAQKETVTRDLPVALFATSTTAAACLRASSDLPLFALVLASPRFEAVRDDLQRLEKPTLLMLDDAPDAQHVRDLASAVFAVTVATVPGVSSLLDHEVASRTAARESALWLRQHVPSLTSA